MNRIINTFIYLIQASLVLAFIMGAFYIAMDLDMVSTLGGAAIGIGLIRLIQWGLNQ